MTTQKIYIFGVTSDLLILASITVIIKEMVIICQLGLMHKKMALIWFVSQSSDPIQKIMLVY